MKILRRGIKKKAALLLFIRKNKNAAKKEEFCFVVRTLLYDKNQINAMMDMTKL